MTKTRAVLTKGIGDRLVSINPTKLPHYLHFPLTGKIQNRRFESHLNSQKSAKLDTLPARRKHRDTVPRPGQEIVTGISIGAFVGLMSGLLSFSKRA
jgi:hypothetical protein